MRFMLEVITALRNNNLRKIPQYDPSVVERARKVLKAIIRNKGRLAKLLFIIHEVLISENPFSLIGWSFHIYRPYVCNYRIVK